jgi:DNA mismatch repair protein MutS2
MSSSPFALGDTVQTPFGKGVVREVRNGGRLMVDVQGRAMIVTEREISVVAHVTKRSRASRSSENVSERARPKSDSRTASREIDLHGLTVEEALDRVELALNDALLADVDEIRFIHGRSGGRLRAALHRRLRDTPSVRGFRLDPRNEGVTLVNL